MWQGKKGYAPRALATTVILWLNVRQRDVCVPKQGSGKENKA